MLDTNTINIVKSTIPLLENAGIAVTDHFYKRMFSANPELKDVFNLSNQKSGRQQFALFSAVANYAKHIDDLGKLGEVVERIAQKHISFDIQPDQYDIVGHHLIETLRELAPHEFTDSVANAWVKAYQVLASVLIDREKQIYQDSAEQLGGWTGPRAFLVKEKIRESELVTSFILVPTDEQPIRPYKPGQYVAVKVKPENSEYEEIRQYSLSDKYQPSHYRISVKRESKPEKGLVSNHLHDATNVNDIVHLMPPAGAFYLTKTTKPIVLISAGVGITPMMSMLESIIPSRDVDQKVMFLHACVNERQHSFKERVDYLTSRYHCLETHYWYSRSINLDSNTHSGLMQLYHINDRKVLKNAEVYMCGPIEFMRFMLFQLHVHGVPRQHIHYETFGPHDDISQPVGTIS